MTALPAAGSVLPAFHADAAHTHAWQIVPPQSVFQAGVIAPLPGDTPLDRRYGFTQAEADLAFAKAQLDGWTMSREDFDYWTSGPPELRWASQVFQVGGAALCIARGLDPIIGVILFAWSGWLASWLRTFPAGKTLPTTDGLASLHLIPAPAHAAPGPLPVLVADLPRDVQDILVLILKGRPA